MERRVVITGMGAVTSLGTAVEPTWRGVLAGRSGVGYIRQFDSRAFPVRIGSEIDLDALPPAEGDLDLPASARAARFGIRAADEAWRDAGLHEVRFERPRGGVCIGASTFPVIEDRLDRLGTFLTAEGLNAHNYLQLYRERPGLSIQSDAASISTLLSHRLKLTGPSLTVQAACSSAKQAVGHSWEMIRQGQMDVALAGGTDSMLSMMCVTGFTLLGSLSKRWECPEKASRPFDRTRDGFVVAEGAAMLTLEEYEFAKRRGARIYAEVIGYGSSCDAYRFTDVHPDGFGIALSMRRALRSAGIAASEVGYINAHGTSTPLNDRCETKAIRTVFGKHADRVAVSSTKSQLGHLLCAAGAVELIFTTLALHHGILPPTINLDHPDPECDLDYVPWKPRAIDLQIAMSNSCGFGGQNGSLILRRWDEKPRPARYRAPPPRVVVTGMGLVSPLGLNVEEHFDSLVRGESAARVECSPELQGLPVPFNARVRDFDMRAQISQRMLRKILTRAASFAVVAGGQALRHAGIFDSREILEDCGLWVGSLGLDQDFSVFHDALRSATKDGVFNEELFATQSMALIDPLFLVKSLPNSGLCGITIEFGIHGPNLNIMNGAVSGLQAIAAAAAGIRHGVTECALAGGYDSLLQLEPALGHLIAGNLSESCCRPFDRTRDGYVLGEGAAFLVLESEEHALSRGAQIYGGVAAGGSSAGPLEDLCRTMIDGCAPDVIFGDGLAIERHDCMEEAVLERCRGARYTAGTGSTGYCGVAGGAFSAIHALMALRSGTIPPTIQCGGASSAFVKHAERIAMQRALVWTSDRGLDNAAIVIER